MSLSTAVQNDRPPHQALGGAGPPDTRLLVTRLGLALAAEGVRYCQWKGQAKRERWSLGDGDVDLLIARADTPRLGAVLHQLGFKLALPPADRAVPGVLSYLGLDAELGRLIHVHLHFHLVIGRAGRSQYRLPIEHAVLGTTVPHITFRTPAPAFELLLLVLQTILRLSPWDAGHRAHERWLADFQQELERLEREVSRAELVRTIIWHLPQIDAAFFDRCREALRPGRSPGSGLLVRHALEWRLRSLVFRPPVVARIRLAAGRAARLVGGTGGDTRKRLAHGGALIALVGADGAGKSSCARTLVKWLASDLRVRHAHMGRPPPSAITRAAAALLNLARRSERRGGESPSSLRAHLELLWCVCTGRDRYRLYRRINRFSRTGGLVICERYPIPENRALVGPSSAQGRAATADSWLATLLRRVEAHYYARMTPPDLVFALRVDPETAIRRKPEEPAAYVRARAGMLWTLRWSRREVAVIDARRPLTEVVAELQRGIWEAL